jgi:hypothetical protein
MEDLIDCGATYISGALHHRIFLSTDASAHLLSEIARSAHRRGLIYYDPQSDTLNLPSSETHNPVESNKQAMIPDGPAITIIYLRTVDGPGIFRCDETVLHADRAEWKRPLWLC